MSHLAQDRGLGSCAVAPLRGHVWARKVGEGESWVTKGGVLAEVGGDLCRPTMAGSQEVRPGAGVRWPGSGVHGLEVTYPSLGSWALAGGVQLRGETCPEAGSSSLLLSLPSLPRQACHLTTSGSEGELHRTSICLGELTAGADTAPPALEPPVAAGADQCVWWRGRGAADGTRDPEPRAFEGVENR